jgi:2-(1,2-epoxy-1,2-dihydrophenyl)acetyl-CoA isomerase
MANYETIEFSIENGLATITLNRPERLNAFSNGLRDDILAAVREVAQADSGARALLITGKGRAFCAGADLADGLGGGENRDMGQALINSYHPMLLEISSLNIPVISAVNGVAAGAGMSLAISADIVIAARSAYFLQAFVNIGLVPDAGSTYILPRLIGAARAKAIMMTGERVPAEKARDWGMIYDVVDDEELLPAATALAQKLADGPTAALNGIRQLIASSLKNTYAEQMQAEALEQRKMGHTSDSREGVLAFLEKRPTKFLGK